MSKRRRNLIGAFALRVVATVVLVMTGPSRLAIADTATDLENRNVGRERYAEGVRLYRTGNFVEALSEFSGAYQATANWRVLYNVAQVQAQLHDYASAIATFERYLQEGGASIDTSRSVEVNTELERMAALVATLEVRSGTSGARVFLDDIDVGPAPRSLRVNVGPRTVRVTAEGFVSASGRVLLSPGEKKVVTLSLTVAPKVEQKTLVIMQYKPRSPTPPAWVTARWVLGVSTVVLAGGAVTMAAVAVNRNGALDDALATQPADRERIDELRSEVRTTGTMADVLFIAGAASLAGLVTALIGPFDSRAPAPKSANRIRLSPNFGGATVEVSYP